MLGEQPDGTFRVEKILPYVVEQTEIADHDKWLEERKTCVGGSEGSIVIGVNPWKSPYALWAEKTGKVKPDDLSGVEAVEWGTLLEEPVARKYSAVTGRRLCRPVGAINGVLRHPEYPFIGGTPDRMIIDADGKQIGVLEIKTTGAHHASDWTDEPPVYYQTQGMQYAAITGVDLVSFAVLIGGQKFHWCDMPRNDRFISYLIEKLEEFWSYVQRDVPPPVDSSKSTAEAIARLYATPDENAEPVILDFEFAEKAERRRELNQIIKDAEAEKLGIDNAIKAALGESVFGYMPDGSGFSWKKQHRGSYVVAAADFRVLREIKVKKG